MAIESSTSSSTATKDADKKKTNTGGGVGGMGEQDSQLPIPNLKVPQLVYQLSLQSTDQSQRSQLQSELISLIKSDEMAPYYQEILDLNFNPPILSKDQSLLSSLQKSNKQYLDELDRLEEKAKEEEGDSEINDVRRKRATYLAKIGEKDKALQSHHEALSSAAGLGSKIDLTLTIIRIGMFHGDAGLTGRAIERCRALITEGGDWDRRNRLKVYEGLHLLSIRDFSAASSLFLDALPTFTATELLSYEDFVGLTVICGVRAEDRKGLKKKIIDSPEILQVIDQLPHLREFSTSLYDCQYSNFFKALASVETEHLLPSRVLGQHSRHYVKECRIIAYKQLLESYRSVTLENFAKAFGVSVEWIDMELAKFISEGRLDARVDKVHGIIETHRSDLKNAQYARIIKEGDVLLNSLQKLSRTAL